MDSKVIDIQHYDNLDKIINLNNDKISGFTAGILDYLDKYRYETDNKYGFIELLDFVDYLNNSNNNYLSSNFNNFCKTEMLDRVGEPEYEVGLKDFTKKMYNEFLKDKLDSLNKDEGINFGAVMNYEVKHYYALNVRYYNDELYLTWANSLKDPKRPTLSSLPTNEVIQKMASILSEFINSHGGKVSKIVSLKLPYKDTLDQDKIDGINNCGPCAIINAHRMSIQPNEEFVKNIKEKIKKCKECTILRTDDISNKEEIDNAKDNAKDNVQDKYSSVLPLNTSIKTHVSGIDGINKTNSKSPEKSNTYKLKRRANSAQSLKINNTNDKTKTLQNEQILKVNNVIIEQKQEKVCIPDISLFSKNSTQPPKVNNTINKANSLVSSKTKTLQNKKLQSPKVNNTNIRNDNISNKQPQSPEVNNTINKDNNINNNPVLNTKKEQEKIDNNVISKKSITKSKENQHDIVENWKKSIKTLKKVEDTKDITNLIDDNDFMNDIYYSIDTYYSIDDGNSQQYKKDYVEKFLAELKPSNNGNSSHVSSIKKKNNNDNAMSI